jgi:chromosome segregation ATPase
MAKLRHTETYNEMKTKLITSDADKYSAEQRLSNMTISYQNLEMTSRTLRQNLEDKEREIWNLRQIVNDRENTIKTLKISHANEIESINTTNENEYQDMQNKIDDLREKINDREEMVKRIQRESSEMQLRAESINMEQRKTYTSQIHELRQKNEQLELNNIDTIDMMRSNKEKYDHQNELLSYDNDRLKSEVSRLQREKEVLHSQIQINEQKNSQEKQRVLQLKHVTDESNKSLKLQIQSLNDEIIALKSHIEKSKEEIRHLHDEQNVLNSKHEAALAAFSAESERKYENLGQTYRSQLEESKKKLMKVVMKERKRGDTYKDHAIEAHRRSKALTGAAMAVAAGEPFPKESLESY